MDFKMVTLFKVASYRDVHEHRCLQLASAKMPKNELQFKV